MDGSQLPAFPRPPGLRPRPARRVLPGWPLVGLCPLGVVSSAVGPACGHPRGLAAGWRWSGRLPEGEHRVCVCLSCLPAGFGYGPPPPPPDQFAPPGVPPPPATPGAAPLAFPPPPSQAAPDMSKPPSAQPDFPYSQYGECLAPHIHAPRGELERPRLERALCRHLVSGVSARALARRSIRGWQTSGALCLGAPWWALPPWVSGFVGRRAGVRAVRRQHCASPRVLARWMLEPGVRTHQRSSCGDRVGLGLCWR